MSDPFMTVFGLGVFYTGLPTKYDTVETTVRNLFYNFSYMHGFLQAKTYFSIFSHLVMHLNIKLKTEN